MKQIFCIVLLMLCLKPRLFAQETSDERFQRRYLEVSVSLLASDLESAHRVADSLVLAASTDEQKVRANMLMAKIYENKGDIRKCLLMVMKADTIAMVAKNYSLMASTSGYLATSFRRLGLLKTSRFYLDRADKANDQQPDKNKKLLTGINILHERAFHSVEDEDFVKAKAFLMRANSQIVIDGAEDSKALQIKATNDQLMGECELKLGNFSAADSFLNSSLIKIGNIETNLRPYIYRSLAEVALARRDLIKARHYLELVEPYLSSAKVEELLILTYRSWSKYYESDGNLVKSIEFKTKSDEILNEHEKKAKRLSSELIEDLRLTKDAYQNRNLLFLWGGAALFMVALIGLSYLYAKQRLYRDRYLALREKNNPEEIKPKVLDEKNESVESDVYLGRSKLQAKNKTREIKISVDTEKRLRKEFLRLEDSHFYLEKSITVKWLASELGTNVNYIAFIIQKYRGKDFYDYVQSKRIEYIIDKVQKSPELVKLKLSYLAEMCGFTSLSTFSTAFKQVTGMPPSAFIHFFRKEHERDVSPH